MPAGRPLKYKTVEEIEPLIEAYFKNTPKDEWTITGLALALDTSRKTLVDYEGRDEFCNTIKRAKDIIENGYEIDLKKSGRTGTIFALKNFDWKDERQIAAKVSMSNLLDDLDGKTSAEGQEETSE